MLVYDWPSAPVSRSLVADTEQLPLAARQILERARNNPSSLQTIKINAQFLHLFPKIKFADPSDLPPLELPTHLPRQRTGTRDYLEKEASWLVLDAVYDISNNRESLHNIYPLAVHIADQQWELEFTMHPLLALINEDHVHHWRNRQVRPWEDPKSYNEEALVVAYLVAMAQRWFTAVEDSVVRLWAVATKRDCTAQIYWADIHRALLPRLEFTVNRSERWVTLKEVQEDRDMLARCVSGIWLELRKKSPAKENIKRWPLPDHLDDNPSTKEEQEAITGRVEECEPLAITNGEAEEDAEAAGTSEEPEVAEKEDDSRHKDAAAESDTAEPVEAPQEPTESVEVDAPKEADVVTTAETAGAEATSGETPPVEQAVASEEADATEKEPATEIPAKEEEARASASSKSKSRRKRRRAPNVEALPAQATPEKPALKRQNTASTPPPAKEPTRRSARISAQSMQAKEKAASPASPVPSPSSGKSNRRRRGKKSQSLPKKEQAGTTLPEGAQDLKETVPSKSVTKEPAVEKAPEPVSSEQTASGAVPDKQVGAKPGSAKRSSRRGYRGKKKAAGSKEEPVGDTTAKLDADE